MAYYYRITPVNELGDGTPVAGSYTPATPQPAPRSVLSVSSNTTLTASADIALVNTSGGDVTIGLAAVSGFTRTVTVKNTGTGKVTVDPAGAETVNGQPTLDLYPGERAELAPAGSSEWESI